MKTLVAGVIFYVALSAAVPPAFSHCEVPCGIYNDKMRIEMMLEHVATIEKAINQVNELSKESPLNFNQIVRWTTNKETHADELQHIVSQYFMTQRVKPVDPSDKAQYDKYVDQVTTLHQILIAAMKAKQTTDTANVEKLRALTGKFSDSYFGQ